MTVAELTIADHHPEFVPTADDLRHTYNRLERAYKDYTSHVSPDHMAMSLEACSYIMWLAVQTRAKRAIDFGSGFTSYVLRVVCDDVVSVDDSPEWLAWTRRFLERHSVDNGRCILWDDYEPVEADLVVYDFSCGQMRDDHFIDAVAAIGPGGVAVLDDAMHINHQKSMRHAALAFGYGLYGLQDYTRDFHRRYCALVVRP